MAVVIVLGTSITKGQTWQTVGGGLACEGVSGLWFDGTSDRLFAVGRFRWSVEDSILLNGTASWFAGEWNPMGDGVWSSGIVGDPCVVPTVQAIEPYDSAMVIGGIFDMADSSPHTSRIAQWKDDQWQPIGIDSSVEGHIYNLSVINDKLHAHGAFQVIDGREMHNWAIWDGVQWMPGDTTEPFDFATTCSAEFQGEYYLGGNFDTQNGLNDLVRGSPGNWEEPGGGLIGDPYVADMVVYGDHLWVTGIFSGSPDTYSKNLIAWNGTEWIRPFPQIEFYSQGWDLHVANGKLYFSGGFNVAGLAGVYMLGVYDGQELCVIGGPDIFTRAIACSPDTLYAAMGYTINSLPGGDVIHYIGKWPLNAPADTCFAVEVGISEPGSRDGALHFDAVHGSILVLHTNGSGALRIHDPLGRLLLRQHVGAGDHVGLGVLSAGTYMAVLTGSDGLILDTLRFVVP